MPLTRSPSWASACSSDEVLPDPFVFLCIKLLRAVTGFHVRTRVQASQTTRRITLPPVYAADDAGLGRWCLRLPLHMRGTHSRPHRGHQQPDTTKRHHRQHLETAAARLSRRWCRIFRQDRLFAAAWLHAHRYRSEPALTMGTEPCVPRRSLVCWHPCGWLWSSTPPRRPRRRTHTATHAHPHEEVGSELGFRVRRFDRIAP